MKPYPEPVAYENPGLITIWTLNDDYVSIFADFVGKAQKNYALPCFKVKIVQF